MEKEKVVYCFGILENIVDYILKDIDYTMVDLSTNLECLLKIVVLVVQTFID
jgi:hypothetical protein